MKVRVTYRASQMAIDETFEGATADAIVTAMQREVAGRLNFLMRPFVLGMTPTGFAQEVVRRYNEATGKSVASPRNCAEFLTLGEAEGIVTILEA